MKFFVALTINQMFVDTDADIGAYVRLDNSFLSKIILCDG